MTSHEPQEGIEMAQTTVTILDVSSELRRRGYFVSDPHVPPADHVPITHEPLPVDVSTDVQDVPEAHVPIDIPGVDIPGIHVPIYIPGIHETPPVIHEPGPVDLLHEPVLHIPGLRVPYEPVRRYARYIKFLSYLVLLMREQWI